MYLENLVFDARDPREMGRSWEAAVGSENLTNLPDHYETRLSIEGGPDLDLCFQPVSEPTESTRLRLLLAEDVADQQEYADTGPLAAIRLESADPDRDAEFWAWLTGWTAVAGPAPRSLRHPSLRGVFLELWPESGPKTVKNPIHLDLRLETGDDHEALAEAIAERGGRQLPEQWGELPWRSYEDPSGNEFCLLSPYPGEPA